jgi:RNAse (barnase) inhibitor barstar
VTTTYVLDGTRVNSLDDFWRVIGEAVNGPGGYFGANLDAFADCLSGGFGTPDDGDYRIEWRSHETSRQALGHPETARQLELRLAHCHPTARPRVAEELAAARAGQGPTVFDWLVGIFEDRAPGVLQLS